MSTDPSRLVEELMARGKIELSDETPASCILATTCTSYDVADMDEYAELVGKEVTLDEFLKFAKNEAQEDIRSPVSNVQG